MDEDRDPTTRKNDVGLSREASAMKTEAEALTMQPSSQDKLGRRIATADARHHS